MSPADPRSVEVLDVFRNDTRVGQLRRTAKGSVFEFESAFYDAHRARPGGLAQHLPYARRTVETEGTNLPTYFAGLLPEGLRLRALVARARTSEDDLFTLLAAAGSDCVGDLFPVLPGDDVPPLAREAEELRPLDRVDFQALFEASLTEAFEPVVPGVQAKLSPSVISFPFATSGRRWLLKLNPPHLARMVENEHFFMSLAAACGLRVARTHLVHDRTGAAGLLVERFDRVRVKRAWRGVHQEDFCQVLDRYPADKYRLKSGDLLAALEAAAAPRAEAARLIDLLGFSYLVGNGDLHGKNLSLWAGKDALQLSPAYDLLCTRPYGDKTLALEFEGRRDNVKRTHFVEFGVRAGLPRAAVERRLDRLIAGVTPVIPRVKELGLDARATRLAADLISKRIDDLAPRR